MTQPIWAPLPSCCREGNSVCVKIPYRGYEISIALDDSCMALSYLGRGNLKVYLFDRDSLDVEDVSSQFGAGENGTLPADAETLKAIFYQIDAMERAC